MTGNYLRGALAGLMLTFGAAGAAFGQTGPMPTIKPWPPYPSQRGLLITQVMPGSPAAMQGLEPGDIILRVNGMVVRSQYDLNYMIGQPSGVAQLDVSDVRTGWVQQMTVFTRGGQLGVIGRPNWSQNSWTDTSTYPQPQPYPYPQPYPRPRPLPLPSPGTPGQPRIQPISPGLGVSQNPNMPGAQRY
jgi:hypothetical protein